MSILGRRVSKKAVAAVAALFVLVLGLLPVTTMSRVDREIVLVARDMAFYLEADSKTANPPLEVRAGETVRVRLLNRDRGMTHDFAVPASDAATGTLQWNEEDAVTFTVPEQAGQYDYVCRPHLLMMKGRLVVRAE